MDVIIAIFVGVVATVLCSEVKAWLPWITEKILSLAVCRLPPEIRGRYDEEWRAYLDAIPGELSKLCCSLDLIRAASRINPQTKIVKLAAQIGNKLKIIRPAIRLEILKAKLEMAQEVNSQLNFYREVMDSLISVRDEIISLSDWEKVDKDVQAAWGARKSLIKAHKAGRFLKMARHLKELKSHNIELELWSKRYK